MSSYPADLRYTKSHEWLRTLQDGTIEVGITDHAQQALGDLVFVEVPEAGRHLAAGDACAVVESVKAASDVYSPIAGEVTSGNPKLATEPELINRDPYGEGWIMRLKPAAAAGSRASPIERSSVGEYVPLVSSPSPAVPANTFWCDRNTPRSSSRRPVSLRATPASRWATSAPLPTKSRLPSSATVQARADSSGVTVSSMSLP